MRAERDSAVSPSSTDAGGATSGDLRRGELLRLIREAGREPVERDTLYHPVERSESTFTVLV